MLCNQVRGRKKKGGGNLARCGGGGDYCNPFAEFLMEEDGVLDLDKV